MTGVAEGFGINGSYAREAVADDSVIGTACVARAYRAGRWEAGVRNPMNAAWLAYATEFGSRERAAAWAVRQLTDMKEGRWL